MTLNTKADSLYFTIQNSELGSRSVIVAMNVHDFRMRPVYTVESGNIGLLEFVNDNTLLIAGHMIELLDIRSKRVIQSCEGNGFRYSYDHALRLLFGTNSRSLTIWKIGDPTYCIKEIGVTSEIRTMTYSNVLNALFTGHENGEINIFDLSSLRRRLTIYGIDTVNFIIQDSEGYYYSTKQTAPSYLSYSKDNKPYLFAQFDNHLNRPDLVAKSLFRISYREFETLQAIYNRRIGNASAFSRDVEIIPFHIVNRYQLPMVTSSRSFSFKVDVANLKKAFDKIIVSVNGSPAASVLIPMKQEATIDLELNTGLNTIRVYATNERADRSSIEEIKVVCKAVTPPDSKIYFIGIGINNYKNDASRKLSFSVKDIKEIAQLLREQTHSVVVDTFLETMATRENILSVKKRLAGLSIEDKLIIAFSGHGILDKNKAFYLATHDIDFNKPSEKGLTYRDLQELMSSAPVRKKLLLIDACHSGEFDPAASIHTNPKNDIDQALDAARASMEQMYGNGVITMDNVELMKNIFADVFGSDGTVAISAARGSSVAWEDVDLQNSTFTYCFKKALSKPKPKGAALADKNHDGLYISELKEFVLKNVIYITHGRQQPTIRMENLEYDWKLIE